MNFLVVLLSPNFSKGAPGHYETWPLALAEAFRNNGCEVAIVGQSGTLLENEHLKYPRVGYALVHPRYPILSPLTYIAIRSLKKRVMADNVIFHLVDGKPESLIAIAPLVLSGHNVAELFIHCEKSERTNKKALSLLESRLKDRVSMYGPKALADVTGISHSPHSNDSLFSLAELKPQRRLPLEDNHKRILVVARGVEMAKKFEREADQLCKGCHFEYHFPLDAPPQGKLPLNVQLANRKVIGKEYRSYVSHFDYHVYMYSEEFKLASGRALDASRLGIPVVIPRTSEIEDSLITFGGTLSADFRAHFLSTIFVHSPGFSAWSQQRPNSVDDYARKALKRLKVLSLQAKNARPLGSFRVLPLVFRQYGSWVLDNMKSKTQRFINLG